MHSETEQSRKQYLIYQYKGCAFKADFCWLFTFLFKGFVFYCESSDFLLHIEQIIFYLKESSI